MDRATYEHLIESVPTTSQITVLELLRMAERSGLSIEGEHAMYFPINTYILWYGMSTEACDLLHEVLTDPRIDKDAGEQFQLDYLQEGVIPGSLPVGDILHLPNEYPDGDRWLPTVFRRMTDEEIG